MAANVVTLPIANIALANGTTTELVNRVQTIVTYLNQGPVGGNTGNASFAESANTANNADYLDGQHGSYYQNASNLNAGTLPNERLSANVPYGVLTGAIDGWYLKHNGSTWLAAEFPTGGVALTANDAYHLNGKHEAELNVNSASTALTANNSTYAFGKSEGDLNVNSALTSNNSTYAYGKTEPNLNVNSAVNANTANNSTYAFGKSEANLNVNSALSANNATYAYGKTEGNLNVNAAVHATNAVNANNADYLDGQHGSYYQNASNMDSGILPAARLSGSYGNVTHLGVLDELYFNVAPANDAFAVGKLVWSDTALTLSLGLNSNTTLQIGQETLVKVVNKTGGTLVDGAAVYISGAQGLRPSVNLALANSHATSRVLGLCTGETANNEEAFITTLGLVRGLNTTGGPVGETWANGNLLFVSNTVPGGLTNQVPVSPHHTDCVGFLVHAHNTQGAIFVEPCHHMQTEDLADIDGPPSANGQVPVWNTADDFFTFKIPPEANNSTYAYGKTEGNLNVNSALSANNATYAFGKSEANLNVNSAMHANDASYLGTKPANSFLSNVALTTLTNGDIIRWSTANSTWYNIELAATANGAPFQKLDTLISQFNGSQTVFIMTSNGDSVTPEGPEHLLISLAGVVQEPGNAYTISGNTITFANPPYSGTTFFGTALGAVTGGAPAPAAAGLTDDGNSGASKTINWGDGNTKHYLVMTANATLTFANANNGGTYTLLLNSGAGGFVATFDANCKWGPGGVPTITQTSNGVDLFTMIYVAATGKYYMSYALGY